MGGGSRLTLSTADEYDRIGGMDDRRIYCLVPLELAGELRDLLRRHFRDEPDIEVVIDDRGRERRARTDRRLVEPPQPAGHSERRKVRNAGGRRIADRRMPVVALPEAERPALPRRARRHADKIMFVERVVLSAERLEDLDTSRLVTRIQGGDRAAFGDLYLRYFDRLYAYLRLALSDRHAAEDATQHVFAQVLEALPNYERRSQPFRAWLFAIARNHAVSLLRKQGNVDLVDPVEIGRRIDASSAREEQLPVLAWISDPDLLLFIERLPPDQRQVLTLRYMMGLSMEEIARTMDKSTEAIRRAHSRGVVFLRHRLAAIGREPRNRRGGRIGALGYRSQARVVRARRFQLVSTGPVR